VHERAVLPDEPGREPRGSSVHEDVLVGRKSPARVREREVLDDADAVRGGIANDAS